ncbi:MAG: hypothetical protein JNM68_02630 [Dinghuibacter sp.]|nr:hypothetical protein [Dinghuibacter sp.]
MLNISIQRAQNQLVCVVDDDGVGRPQTGQAPTGRKSLGIEITRQRIERLMQGASVTIHDKLMNGAPAGTTVTIILPYQTNANA